MLKLSFRKKSKLIGKQSVVHEKNKNYRLWAKPITNYVSYEQVAPFLDEIIPKNLGLGYQQPWDLVERFCELNIGKSNEEQKYVSRKNSLVPLSGIGMSSKYTLTDEDEWVLEFGSQEEKKELIRLVRLSAQYDKKNKNKWEDILKEEGYED